MHWALTVASGLVIAIATSLVTVHLSLKRFYSERWWDRKAASYAAVLEALFHLHQYSDEYYDALIERRDLPDERDRVLRQRWRRASDEIGRAAAIGSFVMSGEAMQVIAAFRSALQPDPNDDVIEQVEQEIEALKVCIPAFQAAAKKDLRVSP